jgi:hypothetical protein
MSQPTAHPLHRASSPIPRLPRFLRLVLIVVSGFTVANVGVRAMGRVTASLPSNPFAAFADIFPGNPGSAIEAYAFACLDNNSYYGNAAEQQCYFYPADSDFSTIDVLIYQGTIIRTTFLPRESEMTVGDLAVLLETNELTDFSNLSAFVLSENVVISRTATRPGQGSPYLPVLSVSFIDKSILNS